MLTQIIGTEQHGFIQGGDITGNLMLVKEIIEYCKEDNIEEYMIMMDFKKAYDRIDRDTMMKTLQAMSISRKIIDLVELLYEDSSAIIVMNDEKRQTLQNQRKSKIGMPIKILPIHNIIRIDGD